MDQVLLGTQLKELLFMTTQLKTEVSNLTTAVAALTAAQALVVPLQTEVTTLTGQVASLTAALAAAEVAGVDQPSLDAINAAIAQINSVASANAALVAATPVPSAS